MIETGKKNNNNKKDETNQQNQINLELIHHPPGSDTWKHVITISGIVWHLIEASAGRIPENSTRGVNHFPSQLRAVTRRI